jgi:hypothetical protein
MKNKRFFFSVVAVAVVLGVFFFFFFGFGKPRLQSAVRDVNPVDVAVVKDVVVVPNEVSVVGGVVGEVNRVDVAV